MPGRSTRLHIGNCPLCEQGLIRLVRCPNCTEWSAICDECEAIWADPHSVHDQRPNSQHPYCPHCQDSVGKWIFGNRKQISQAGYEDLLEGSSL